MDVIKYELCTLNNKILQSYNKNTNNNYIIINNNTRPLIIYHKDQKYVLPKCTKINEITISPYNKNTVDPEIHFNLQDMTYKGYLKENNIITKDSEKGIIKEWKRTVNFGKTIVIINSKEIKKINLNNSVNYFEIESYTENENFNN